MTYATLQTAIADNTHRTDLTAKIPDFIALAEAFLFRELNIRSLETSTTGTTTGGLITLPADFAYLVKVTTTYGGREYTLDYGGDPRAETATSGLPYGYVMESGGLRLYPEAGTGYAYTIYYGMDVSPLSGSVSTNWLLDNAYDLYLQASLIEAFRYTQNTEQEARLSSLVGPMVESVRRMIERKAQPSRGGLQIKPRR
jgi:hypothetical protein